MRRTHLSLMAAATASMALMADRPPPVRVEKRDEIDGEKMSRQRKRWLQRQARKATRQAQKR